MLKINKNVLYIKLYLQLNKPNHCSHYTFFLFPKTNIVYFLCILFIYRKIYKNILYYYLFKQYLYIYLYKEILSCYKLEAQYKGLIKHEPCQCDWQKCFPSKQHELIVSIPRQCLTYPDKQKYNCGCLQGKPNAAGNPRQQTNWRSGSSKEKKASYGTHHNNLGILCNKEKLESHCLEFYVVSLNKFLFLFWQIKRGTISFSQSSYNPNKKQWPQWKQIPSIILCIYQTVPIQTILQYTYSKYYKTQWQLIANHLCNRTATSKKGIFTITCPSCQQNSINSKTTNLQNIHCTQIQITNSTCSTSRQCSPCCLTSQESQNRCPNKKRLVCITRQNRFFQKKLLTIQKWLKKSTKAPHIGPLTTLHLSHYSALNQSKKLYSKKQRHYGGQYLNQNIYGHFLIFISTMFLQLINIFKY